MAKRSFGEVVRRRRPDRTLLPHYYVRWRDAGGRVHQAVAGTTRASAEALLDRIEGEERASRPDPGTPGEAGRAAVRDAERPLSYHVPRILRAWRSVLAAGTMRDRPGCLSRWSARLGRRPVFGITGADLQERVQRMREAGLAASTIRTEVRILSAAFTTMKDALRIPIRENPCHGLVLPPVHVNPRPHLTPAEVNRVVQAAPADCALAILLLADAGLRPAELWRLTWEEVALDLGVLRLARTKTYLTRTIPLTDRARAALEAARKALRRDPKPGDLVLAVQEARVRVAFRKAARAAGLGKLVPYTMRHAWACGLLMAGASAPVVRDLLGHANLRTTDVYSRSLPGDAGRAAVDALQRTRSQEAGRPG